MLDFTINYQNFSILFGSYLVFIGTVYSVSMAISLLKKELN